MKPHTLTILCTLAFAVRAHAQITVERVFHVDQNLPDNGQFMDVRIFDAGFASITDVDVTLELEGAAGTSMRLGDYYVSLTHGAASEDERVAVLLNRPQMTNTALFGSSLSSANITFDDSGALENVFNITTPTGTFAADGRLGVNPYAPPVPYRPGDITNGLAALNGDLVSDTWHLLIADTRQGAAGRLDSWTLRTTGTSAESGLVDPGAGGSISDDLTAPVEQRDLKAVLSVSGSGTSGVTAKISEKLLLSGGLSGGGQLFKTGAGSLSLGGNSSGGGGVAPFSGSIIVRGGELAIVSSLALGAGGVVSLAAPNVALRLGTQDAIANNIDISGGTIAWIRGDGTLSGNISGQGGIQKSDTGTITLSGENTYTGPTSIQAGSLIINGVLASPVEVGLNASLAGSGHISGDVQVSGEIFPGDPTGSHIGSLGVGDLALGSDSTFTYAMSTSTLHGSLIHSEGNLGIEWGASLVFTGDLTALAAYGSKLTLISYLDDWDGGLFTVDGSPVADGSTLVIGPNRWIFDYANSSGGSNFSGDQAGATKFVTITAVPEPGILLIVNLTIFGWLARRRR
jgi:autotransporter-associated beta strand protein